MIRNSLFIILLAFLCLWPLATKGAILYLEPLSGQYQPGDVFGVEMKIDTEGECINVIEANLKFSQDTVKAVDFSRGRSIITLWVKEPEINQETGVISFSGGIPNGYCGRIPGDPGASNLLGRIIFRVPGMIVGEPGKNLARIEILDTSQVFLNDGLGTKAKTIVQGANFEILKKPESSKDEWQEEIKKDNISPESFKIEISQDLLIFEGKYFITFSTTDKQTGIDHYKIKEGKRDWKIAISPYVLENQRLTSDIWVKAVDKAGNEWIEIVKASRKTIWYYILYGVLVLIGLLVIIIAGNRIKKL
jgi:hypothetical protein